MYLCDELEAPTRQDCGYGETRGSKQRDAVVVYRSADDRCVTDFHRLVLYPIAAGLSAADRGTSGDSPDIDCRVVDYSAVDAGTLVRMRF